MGRREVRRMLMGPKKPWWGRKGVLPAVMAAMLALGLGLGIGIARWSDKPAKVAVAPPAQPPAQPPAPRSQRPNLPDPAAEETGAAVVPVPLIMPQPPVKPMEPGTPAWLRYAVPVPNTHGLPMIAVIIDDLGVDRRRSERVTMLRPPLTLAYMTYAEELPRQTAQARARGHELMVHVPMQPLDGNYNPGPDVLEVQLSPDELRKRLDWGLSRFEGYIGINNHMGSRFTADRSGMKVVMEEMKRRGTAFVDSVTSDKTVGSEMAKRYGVPFAARQVFLDNEQDVAQVRAQLAKVEAYARKHGAAVAIGHPHDTTIEALAAWLPGLEGRGFVLVPVSAIIRQAPTG